MTDELAALLKAHIAAAAAWRDLMARQAGLETGFELEVEEYRQAWLQAEAEVDALLGPPL